MDASGFISLGGVNDTAAFDTGEKPRAQIVGKAKTTEERKDVQRAFRLAAKKEHKKEKSDAKKQRKENAVQHRRMTKNSAKYAVNKTRNHIRDIENERYRIRTEAVRQAERLAAKYDKSGKSFNVGEIVVMEDGSVRSKAWVEAKEAARKARENGEVPEIAEALKAVETKGVNPARVGLIAGIEVKGKGKAKEHISNTQLKRKVANLPKPTPPKPVLPDGIEVPEGEEDLIALWDLDDAGVEKRIARAKNQKKVAAKALRKQQAEQKKFNKALKAKKKESNCAGIPWDPVKATKEILAAQEAEQEEEEDSESSDESDSGDSEGENSDDGLDLIKAVEMAIEPELQKSRSSKRPAEEPLVEEPKTKKNKKSKSSEKDVVVQAKTEEVEMVDAPVVEKQKNKPKSKKVELNTLSTAVAIDNAEDKTAEQKIKKKSKSNEVEVEVATATIDLENEITDKKKKKRRSQPLEEDPSLEITKKEQSKKSKKSKKSKITDTATEQEPEEASEPSRKEKKSKKDKKPKTATTETTEPESVSIAEPPKKEKKSKKEKTTKSFTAETTRSSDPSQPSKLSGPKINIALLNPSEVNARVTSESKKAKAFQKKVDEKVVKLTGQRLEPHVIGADVLELTVAELRLKRKREKPGYDSDEEERKKERAKENRLRKKELRASFKTQANSKPVKVDTAVVDKNKAFGEKMKLASAAQWNPDALGGGDDRKSKFLRLLGGGKVGNGGEVEKKETGKGVRDIEKLQGELERQYEIGMKMKHDGGGKRRGLGA